MGYILSVNMSSSEKMCSLTELSTMNFDTSESNKNCSENSTIEEIMWYILSFEIMQNTKGLFLVWPLGEFFIAFKLGFLEFGLYLLVLHFCLAKSVFGTLIHFSLNFGILDRLW